MRFDLRAWCALLRAPGVGSKTYHTLLEAFGSPEAFFHAPIADIRKRLPNLSADKIVAWQAMLDDPAVNADLDWLQQGDGRHIIPLHHPAYPPLLRETDDAPPLLFVHGDAALLATTQIAIVGSRNATEPARRTCHSFAQDFAQAGITVTSGLALGIDGAAHEGALQGGGKTIAVVGTGLDRVYPARHHDLAHRISAQGAIVSEYPIGTGVRAGN
ncbi:DNA-processing protein DprA, partial [Cardiobacterium hominis]|uniref:DNA-processing protein DprA n=1 Tax=Cardiobacterium hominis TaxID=2718 RepID=UPI0028EE61EE